VSQPHLFEPPAAEGNLKPRQQAVLDRARQAGRDGISAEDAGTVLHALRKCRWCERGTCLYLKSEGRDVLKALKAKDLVTEHRGGVWRAVGATTRKSGHDPATAPFPEGF
jgi:hypothetical protein